MDFGFFCIAAVTGLGIGLLSGLLGVGGGTVMVPVFRLAFGLAPVVSTATSLLTIIPTSISGVVSHVRRRTCLPRLGVAMGIGGALTSPLGAWLSTISPTWLVMLTVSLVIVYSAVTMLRKALKPGGPSGSGGGALQADQGQKRTFSRRDLLKASVIGLVAGLFSGYVGLGGGFLMVPLMTALLGMPMRLASGTSLIAVMILATPGAITQVVLGNVDFAVALATAIGAIPGAFIGARLVKRVPERGLRLMFAGFLLVGAILLVIKELGALG